MIYLFPSFKKNPGIYKNVESRSNQPLPVENSVKLPSEKTIRNCLKALENNPEYQKKIMQEALEDEVNKRMQENLEAELDEFMDESMQKAKEKLEKASEKLDLEFQKKIDEYLESLPKIEAKYERKWSPKLKQYITMCSKTTRELFLSAGIDRDEALSGRWASKSKKLNEEKYGPMGTELPSDPKINILDIYIKLSKDPYGYGHRAFVYKSKGEWIVVDPYLSNAGKGMPYEQYAAKYKIIGIQGHIAKEGTTIDKINNPEKYMLEAKYQMQDIASH